MKYVSIAVLTLAARLAYGSGCPCDVDGIKLSDDDMAACPGPVHAIYAIRDLYVRRGLAVPVGATDNYRGALERCLSDHRQQAEQTARMNGELERQQIERAKLMDQRRREQLEAEAAHAEREHELDRLRSQRRSSDLSRQRDRRIMATLASAQLCSALDDRSAALKSIADEHRYARQAGVINLSDLEGFKADLREADETIANNRSVMRKQGWPAMSCSTPEVKDVKNCLQHRALDVQDIADPNDPCDRAPIQAFLRLISL